MSEKEDPNATEITPLPKTPQTEALDGLDFSSLTMDSRRNPRFPYRGSALVSKPNSLISQSGACIDVSRNGLAISFDRNQFEIGQEVTIEFFGPGAPAVQGLCRVVNLGSETREGRTHHRLGFLIQKLSRVAEQNFSDFLGQLESRSGFDFSDAR